MGMAKQSLPIQQRQNSRNKTEPPPTANTMNWSPYKRFSVVTWSMVIEYISSLLVRLAEDAVCGL